MYVGALKGIRGSEPHVLQGGRGSPIRTVQIRGDLDLDRKDCTVLILSSHCWTPVSKKIQLDHRQLGTFPSSRHTSQEQHQHTDRQNIMVKRKRKSRATLQDRLEEHDVDVFRALKAAKGFERQRQAKRFRAAAAEPEKQARIEKEISMLKVRRVHQSDIEIPAITLRRAGLNAYA